MRKAVLFNLVDQNRDQKFVPQRVLDIINDVCNGKPSPLRPPRMLLPGKPLRFLFFLFRLDRVQDIEQQQNKSIVFTL